MCISCSFAEIVIRLTNYFNKYYIFYIYLIQGSINNIQKPIPTDNLIILKQQTVWQIKLWHLCCCGNQVVFYIKECISSIHIGFVCFDYESRRQPSACLKILAFLRSHNCHIELDFFCRLTRKVRYHVEPSEII